MEGSPPPPFPLPLNPPADSGLFFALGKGLFFHCWGKKRRVFFLLFASLRPIQITLTIIWHSVNMQMLMAISSPFLYIMPSVSSTQYFFQYFFREEEEEASP